MTVEVAKAAGIRPVEALFNIMLPRDVELHPSVFVIDYHCVAAWSRESARLRSEDAARG